MKFDVSVVIANWNTVEWTKEAVRSVFKQSGVSCEVIVVDNGSEDGTERWARKLVRTRPDRSQVLMHGKNYGPGKAWNDGIILSSGHYLCILNSDAKMAPDCLKKMIETLSHDRTIAITGPMCNNISSRQYSAGPVDRANFVIPAGHVMPFVCVLIPRPIFGEVGLLAERFAMGGSEDVEFCNRVHKAGFKTVVTGNAFCWHALSQTYKANKVDVNQANRVMSAKLGELEHIRRLAT